MPSTKPTRTREIRIVDPLFAEADNITPLEGAQAKRDLRPRLGTTPHCELLRFVTGDSSNPPATAYSSLMPPL